MLDCNFAEPAAGAHRPFNIGIVDGRPCVFTVALSGLCYTDWPPTLAT